MSREEIEKRILEARYSLVSSKDKETIDILEELAIKTLEQEPRKDEVILTKEEYGELVSSEFDNGYAKGYREALEQEPILDKIRAEIEQEYNKYRNMSEKWNERACGIGITLEIIDKYRKEN